MLGWNERQLYLAEDIAWVLLTTVAAGTLKVVYIYIHTKVVVLEAKVLEVQAVMKKLYSSVCMKKDT
jgi:hypothetical protein